MTNELTATDIREGLVDAPITMAYLAQLLNAGNFLRAGQIVAEQAQFVRGFRRALDNNRAVESESRA